MTDETEGLVSTDEAILNSIGEGEDESTSSEGTSVEDTGETQDTTEAAPSTSGEQSPEQVADGEQPKPASGPQDLVDREGNVIAAGGKERRFYETAQREKARAESLNKEVETLKSQMEAITNAGTLGTQYNLSPEELTTGAQIIASYKDDPVQTLQYLLTQAQAAGHNVEAITGGGGLTPEAIKQMLDNALKPVIAEHTERADTQAANEQALEIYNGFMSQFPDAAVHEDSLSRLLKEQPSLSPEAAYFKLRSYYLERNLDWTKSLEQLNAEAQQKTSPSVNTQQALPSGHVTETSVTDTAQVADVNTSTDDIIRQAMAEAGLN